MVIMALLIIAIAAQAFLTLSPIIATGISLFITGYSILLVLNIILTIVIILIFYFANKNGKFNEPEIQKVYLQIQDAIKSRSKFKRVLIIIMSIMIFFLAIGFGLYVLAILEIVSELLNILIYDSITTEDT